MAEKDGQMSKDRDPYRSRIPTVEPASTEESTPSAESVSEVKVKSERSTVMDTDPLDEFPEDAHPEAVAMFRSLKDDLNYTPSVKVSKSSANDLKKDPEYQTYLRLREKFSPLEEGRERKNTFLKVLNRVFWGIFIVFFILFSIGFVMGSRGHKPQQLDWSVITNQMGDEEGEFSELTRVDEVQSDER